MFPPPPPHPHLEEKDAFSWKKIREIPSMLKRLMYIYSIVWETSKGIMIAVIGLAIFSGFEPILSAYLLKFILDFIFNAGSNPEYRALIIAVVLWIGISFIVRLNSLVNMVINQLLGILITRNIKLKIINKAKNLDLASYDDTTFYSRLENADREASMRPIHILQSSLNLVSSIIKVIGFVAIIATFSIYIFLIQLVLMLPMAVISMKFRSRSFHIMFRHSKERRQMDYYSRIIVDKDMIKEVKLFDMSGFLIDSFNKAFDTYYGNIKKLTLKQGKWMIITMISAMLYLIWVFITLGRSAFYGDITIGDFSLYSNAIISSEGAFQSIIETMSNLYEGTLFIENLRSFFQEKETIKPVVEPPKACVNCIHSIEFVNVSFKYPKMEKYVLKNISFKIEPGQVFALVGFNGAGKTTLLKLMMRLYDPSEGKVLIDGLDIREYDINSLYRLFGTVFQDFGRYAFMLKENIALGELSEINNSERLGLAIQQANLQSVVHSIPNGLDTPLTRMFEKDGQELSIGQWQKIAIARAFFRQAEIMIFDEPSSALDANAEEEIFRQFVQLSQNKTAIFVSHRLSSATLSDKVIYLEDGEIKEMGSHHELMELRGKYAEFFSKQAKRYQMK